MALLMQEALHLSHFLYIWAEKRVFSSYGRIEVFCYALVKNKMEIISGISFMFYMILDENLGSFSMLW